MILPDLSSWSHDNQSGCLAHAATQRGIAYLRIMAARTPGGTPEPWISLEIGGRGYFFSQALLISNPDPADPRKAHHVNGPLAHVTIDKHAGKGLLAGLGVPVPAGEVFAAADLAEAEAFFARMSGPACVKPARGKQGLCCTPWLRDGEAFREAFLTAARSYPSIVVEEHLEGEQVRLFYVRPSVVGLRRGLVLSCWIGRPIAISPSRVLPSTAGRRPAGASSCAAPRTPPPAPIPWIAARSCTPLMCGLWRISAAACRRCAWPPST